MFRNNKTISYTFVLFFALVVSLAVGCSRTEIKTNSTSPKNAIITGPSFNVICPDSDFCYHIHLSKGWILDLTSDKDGPVFYCQGETYKKNSSIISTFGLKKGDKAINDIINDDIDYYKSSFKYPIKDFRHEIITEDSSIAYVVDCYQEKTKRSFSFAYIECNKGIWVFFFRSSMDYKTEKFKLAKDSFEKLVKSYSELTK